jgi:hypothetical protein
MDQNLLARLERVKIAIARSLQLWGHDHVWALDHCEMLIERLRNDDTAARVNAILTGSNKPKPKRPNLSLVSKQSA